jgi:hypothetical protein
MTNLKIVNAMGSSGISDKGIKDLNLDELYAEGNSKISLNHKN